MTISKQPETILRLYGNGTVYEVETHHQELLSALRNALNNASKNAPQLTLDLAEIASVDSSFLQLLVATQKQAEHDQIKLVFKNAPDVVDAAIKNLYFPALVEVDLTSAAREFK